MRHFLLILIFCISCGRSPQTKIDGVAMGMRYMVLFKSKLSTTQQSQVIKTIEALLEEIDSTLNRWNKNSEISKWNHSSTTQPTKISPLLLKALLVSDQVHKMSSGLFDPTLGKAIHEWKMALRTGQLLGGNEVQSLKISTGWNKIKISGQTLQKTLPNIELDFDGITKGLFCDILTANLQKLGFKNFLVEWAGEIKISGGPFKILSGESILTLENTSIATSGPNYQLFNVHGKLYSHFVSPETLLPIEIKDPKKNRHSINESCAIADGMATSLFL
jgi:FAD:protein FMN transferase